MIDETGSLFVLALSLHARLQTVLIERLGFTGAELKGDSVVLALHGKPRDFLKLKSGQSASIVKVYLLLGWQNLNPKLSIFVECQPVRLEADGGVLAIEPDSLDPIRTPLSLTQGASREHMIFNVPVAHGLDDKSLLPGHIRIANPTSIRFVFRR